MKKGLVFVFLAVLAVNAFAQTAIDYLKDSLVNVLTVSTMIQLADYEYESGSALWGTYLEPGKTVSLSSQFDTGVEYLMLASAHNPNRDVDLKVYQGRGTSGTVVAKDTRSDASPVVRFVPAVSGYHTFELINSGTSPAFVSLVTLKYKRNGNFSFNSLVEALNNTLVVSEYLAANLSAQTIVPPNKWTLFGGNVQQGSNTGYFNTTLSNGVYILVGAGENSVTNCDIEVVQQTAYDNQSGRTISQNTGSNFPFDFGAFSADSSKYYYLKVHNKASQKSSSFVFGFLIQPVQ